MGLDELVFLFCPGLKNFHDTHTVDQGLKRTIRNRKTDHILTQDACHAKMIVKGVVKTGGNTTMLQLAAKINSASIGRSPFTFDIKGGTSYPAGFFGLNLNKAAKVYLPPVLHAYIGSDISAGPETAILRAETGMI